MIRIKIGVFYFCFFNEQRANLGQNLIDKHRPSGQSCFLTRGRINRLSRIINGITRSYRHVARKAAGGTWEPPVEAKPVKTEDACSHDRAVCNLLTCITFFRATIMGDISRRLSELISDASNRGLPAGRIRSEAIQWCLGGNSHDDAALQEQLKQLRTEAFPRSHALARQLSAQAEQAKAQADAASGAFEALASSNADGAVRPPVHPLEPPHRRKQLLVHAKRARQSDLALAQRGRRRASSMRGRRHARSCSERARLRAGIGCSQLSAVARAAAEVDVDVLAAAVLGCCHSQGS